MEETGLPIGTVSDGQIESWKKEHGANHIFEYKSEDNKVGYFRTPTLQMIDACKTVSGRSVIKYKSMLIENCWLGGCDELRKNDEYMLGLFEFIEDIIVIKVGELRRL